MNWRTARVYCALNCDSRRFLALTSFSSWLLVVVFTCVLLAEARQCQALIRGDCIIWLISHHGIQSRFVVLRVSSSLNEKWKRGQHESSHALFMRISLICLQESTSCLLFFTLLYQGLSRVLRYNSCSRKRAHPCLHNMIRFQRAVLFSPMLKPDQMCRRLLLCSAMERGLERVTGVVLLHHVSAR